VYMGY